MFDFGVIKNRNGTLRLVIGFVVGSIDLVAIYVWRRVVAVFFWGFPMLYGLSFVWWRESSQARRDEEIWDEGRGVDGKGGRQYLLWSVRLDVEWQKINC